MIETIISNNCAGGAILHELGMEFKTPTINLQILPEQYTRFCNSFDYYMMQELKECDKGRFTLHEEVMLSHMFGGVPDMPYGLLDDILVCFQHYGTFEEARSKWNERKERLNDIFLDEMLFLFHARGPEYQLCAERFVRLDLPHTLCLTQGFDAKGAVRIDVDPFAAAPDGKQWITKVYDWQQLRGDM